MLTVKTDIPYGNAAGVRIEKAKGKTMVRFRSGSHGGPEAMWFCFRVQGGTAKGLGELSLILENTENMLGGQMPENFRPVYREKGKDWIRTGEPIVTELADGRKEAEWGLQTKAPFLDFAFCYPYGIPETEKLLKESRGYYKKDVIGSSQTDRDLIRISNSYGKIGSKRPGVYFIARQHSAETPGSWVLDGVLRHFATLGNKAPLTWVVPLSNIDGVEQGDYGKDNFPYDLNRAWGIPMRHETLVIKRDVTRWMERCKPVLMIDYHAPGASEATGVYTFLPKPKKRPKLYKRALAIAEVIEKHLGRELCRKDFARTADYPSRWETPNFTDFGCELGVDSLSFETPYAIANNKVFTRERYVEAGKRIGKAFVEVIGKKSQTK